jgi:Flp pilus assembly protein TadG
VMAMEMARRGRSGPRRAGAAAVEAAVVIPLALALIMGMFEFSRLLMVQNMMHIASAHGARYAVVHTDSATTDQVLAEVESKMPPATRPFVGYSRNTNIQVYRSDASGVSTGTWSDASFNQYIACRISGLYRAAINVNLVGFNELNLQAISVMYSEAN